LKGDLPVSGSGRCRSHATRRRTAPRGSPVSSRQKHEDNEKTFAELKARIAKALAYVKTLDAKAIDAALCFQFGRLTCPLVMMLPDTT
jgi:hypothetical protein